MTIAACYVSPEGVVLGADSTSTYGNPGDPHYYNHSQKLFEIGEGSTLGVVTWGLGGLQVSSHRTLFAQLSDDLRANPATSIQDVATRWATRFWQAYTNQAGPIFPAITRCRDLNQKPPFDASAVPPDPHSRTKDEESEFLKLWQNLVTGFCIAGYVTPDRNPAAYEIVFHPLLANAPVPADKPQGYWFWGAPNMIQRLLFACDDGVKDSIVNSGKWVGTRQELDTMISKHALAHPIIGIREAIDFVHACIYSTIKAFKFSLSPQICGGPIELAVITTDRQFRWVRHKSWDSAIIEVDPE
jgi:hypothetical protein